MPRADVLVVGGGPAGLAVGYHLRNSGLRIAVLESTSEVGGRTRTLNLAGERVNAGAMWVYVGTESDRLCRELGVETLPVHPATYGIHYAGRTVVAREDDDLVQRLELPPVAATELTHLLATVRDEYATFAGEGDLAQESSALAEMTFTDHLGDLHPDVRAIVDNAVRAGSTARPEDLSAQYALRYFASYLVRSPNHRRYIPRGMQSISEALAQALPDGTVHLDSPVRSVLRSSEDRYEVTVTSGSMTQVWDAEQVVLAVPGEGAIDVAPWLPDWKTRSIERVPSSPTVVLSIVVNNLGMEEWDDLFFVATVGQRFNAVLQPRAAAGQKPSEHGLSYFNCYLSADLDAAVDDDDDGLKRDWLESFFTVIPAARDRVLATAVSRWPRCFAYPAPGRDRVIDDVRRPIDGLHFVGDYTSMTAGSHGALSEARRVAAEIRGNPTSTV